MESVDAKMVRAKEHLDTLHAEAGVFFESTKRNFILKSNGQEAWIVHYIEGSIPPIRLGVLLGECVFDIRSALDNLVCGLIRTADSDTYSRLYETFLEEYDHALRRRSGTYYTPIPVARATVSFVDSVLKSRLGRARGFASHDVFSLDPSMGAGTFLAEIMENAAETLRQQRRSPAAHLRELFAKRRE